MTYATTCNRCNGTGLRQDRNETATTYYIGPCEAIPAWSRGNKTKDFFVCRASGKRIRKNGTCSAHACYWCDGTPKLSPRAAFLQEIGSRVNALDARFSTSGAWPVGGCGFRSWRELCVWIADNGPSVSRAAAWQSACEWFNAHRTDEAPRWAVLQGTVYLSHASGV